MKKIFTNIINNNNVFMKKKKTIITRGYQSIFVSSSLSSSSNYLKCYSNNNFKRDVSTAAKTPITKGEPVPISEPSLKQTNTNKSSIGLYDSHGRNHTYLRLSLTERCNLRCQYCMPEEGNPIQHIDKLLAADELIQIANFFVNEGIDKIRLTGGEPLISPHALDICKEIGANEHVKLLGLTTNGLTLPRKLPKLIEYGVNRINISLDTLVEPKFEFLTRRKGFKRVMQSIYDTVEIQREQHQRYMEREEDFRYRSPFEMKINVVLMNGINDDELGDFVELTRNDPINVRFIEFMPFSDNKWNHNKFISYRDALQRVCADERFQDTHGNPLIHAMTNDFHDTAKSYQVDGFVGKFGFISSMTENFCTGCNRIRVTADGDFKVCLFGNEEDSISLRDILRDHNNNNNSSENNHVNTILKESIQTALNKKHRTLGGNKNMFDISKSSSKNRSMTRIGGFSTLARNNIHINNNNSDDKLSHVDIDEKTGNVLPTMVDVGNKNISVREATAHGVVKVPPSIAKLIKDGDGNGPKGPILSTAIIAGTMGAKNTSNLIPFCHPLQIDRCKINMNVNYNDKDGDDNDESTFSTIDVYCNVRCSGKTGVEMEALTGCSIAALTIYDMTKALSHNIVLGETKLMKKTGGKSDFTRTEKE